MVSRTVDKLLNDSLNYFSFHILLLSFIVLVSPLAATHQYPFTSTTAANISLQKTFSTASNVHQQ